MRPHARQPMKSPRLARSHALRHAKDVASVRIAVAVIADGAMARMGALRAKVSAKVRETDNAANRVATVRRVPIAARAPNHALSAPIAVRARSSKAARNVRRVNPVVNRGLQKRVLNPPQPKPHSPACHRNSNAPNPASTDKAKVAKNAAAAVVAVIVIAKDASRAKGKTGNAGNIGKMASGQLQQLSLSMMSSKRRWLLRPFL